MDWKIIPTQPNYEAHPDGLIRKPERNNFQPKQSVKHGVVCVALNGTTNSVAKLIAMTFIPNPNNYQKVRHIDGDTKNNNVNNLEWFGTLTSAPVLNPVSPDAIWKTIPTQIDYEASSDGEIRRISNKRITRQTMHKRDKILVTSLDGQTYQVDHLVAEAFIDNPECYRFVIHLDNNKDNNKADNLIWSPRNGLDKEFVKELPEDSVGICYWDNCWLENIYFSQSTETFYSKLGYNFIKKGTADDETISHSIKINVVDYICDLLTRV